MKENNILTFMVTCYNQQDVIGKTIETLINQNTEYKYQILISDDNSTDNSYSILKNYEKNYDFIKVIKVENKKKVGKNRNNLLNNVETKYACFIDGDDVQQNDYAEKIISSLDGKPIYHLKGFDEIWSDSIQRKYTQDYENIFLYVFSKEIISKVKFNEDIEIGEDYLFSLMYYDLLNNDFKYIDTYYQLNRKEDNTSLTKNGDISKRYKLELQLYNLIKGYEGTNSIVSGKINEKKIDIINFSVLTDNVIPDLKVNLKRVRNKHKLSYIAYRIFKILRLNFMYKYFVNKTIGYKI